MPMNLDVSGTVEDRASTIDKVQFLLAGIVSMDWDNPDYRDLSHIEGELEMAVSLLKQELDEQAIEWLVRLA